MGIHLLADHDVVPEAAAPGALPPAKRGSRALPVATGIGLGAATYPCTSFGPSSGRAAAAGWPAPACRTLFLKGSAHSGLRLSARRRAACRPSAATGGACPCVSREAVRALRTLVRELVGQGEALVFVEQAARDFAGEPVADHPAPHVVARGDRGERARVVVEAGQ